MRESDIAAMLTVPKPAAETVLYVTITVNGDDDSAALTKVRRSVNGDLAFDRAGLIPLRFDPAKLPPGDWIPASALGPAKIELNEVDLRMKMTVPAEFLTGSTLTQQRTSAAKISRPSWGGLLNYQFFGFNDQTGKNGLYSLYTEPRLLSPYGVTSSTGIYTYNQGRQTYMRYDTSWHNSWPDKLITTTVGDYITGSLNWTSPVRMGGFQISKSFTLRPDLITFPVPSFSGTAAATSGVDLYVNHNKQYSGQVVSGPFTLNTVPNVTGAASADVVVHNALGQDTVQHLTFYVEPRLLATGLTDYSMEVGFLRRYYGVEQAAYDHMPAVSGVYRKGVSSNFTFETHAEAGGDYHAAAIGVGGLWSLPAQLGVLNVSGLANPTGAGSFTLGYSNLHQRSGVFASVSKTIGNYRDLSSTPGYNTSPLQWQTGVSFPAGKTGAISLNISDQAAINNLADSARRTVGISYSVQPTARLNMFLSLSRDMAGIKATSMLLGLSYSFDSGLSLSSDVARSSTDKKVNVDVSAQKSPPYDEGFGWRVTGRNNIYSGTATGMYRNKILDSSLEIGQDNKTTAFQANINGSVLWMDNDVLLGREVTNGFALVATGYPKVPVLRENRIVGNTNSSGHILVNDLNPYQNTVIAIDPRSLPAGVDADVLSKIVSTKASAGVLVPFSVKPLNGALLILNGADGKPLPLGTLIELEGEKPAQSVVGYDGQAFVTGLSQHNTLNVTLPAGVCRVQFDYNTTKPGELPRLGPFVCKP